MICQRCMGNTTFMMSNGFCVHCQNEISGRYSMATATHRDIEKLLARQAAPPASDKIEAGTRGFGIGVTTGLFACGTAIAAAIYGAACVGYVIHLFGG